MNHIALEKQQLRQQMRTLLRGFSQAQRILSGTKVAAHFASWHDLTTHKNLRIAFFNSLPDEVSTEALSILFSKRQLFCALPYIDHGEMRFFDASHMPLDDKKAGFQAERPTDRPNVDVTSFDVVLVPGLAFDRFGHRLGRGKGYYDRTLAKMTAHARRPLFMGVAMDEQAIASVPHEPHDVTMDFLCTPAAGMLHIR